MTNALVGLGISLDLFIIKLIAFGRNQEKFGLKPNPIEMHVFPP